MNNTAPIATPTTGTMVARIITFGSTISEVDAGTTTELFDVDGVLTGVAAGSEGVAVVAGGELFGLNPGVSGSMTVATQPVLIGLVR